MKKEDRQESEVFADLERICSSPGYIHVIAYFCFRDNTIRYGDQMLVEDVLEQYIPERLLRTEISTLLGLTFKKKVDFSIPSPEIFQKYIDETQSLLNEIHKSMLEPLRKSFVNQDTLEGKHNPFRDGYAIRESIFYGGEAAYGFQYRDLARLKYQKDNDWFLNNKGYSIEQASAIVSSISTIQIQKASSHLKYMLKENSNNWTVLPVYTFSISEIVSDTGLDNSVVVAFIKSFEINSQDIINNFSSLDDFNPTNAYPILGLDETNFLLLQHYSLLEAFYETPFFWFSGDPSYKDIAMQHRGKFVEDFSAQRLRLVFGENRVFTNVEILNSSKIRVGEIDVLVVFADRIIIVQAKSKKLTIASRKGNDKSLQDDFKKAIQESYDQGYSCARFLQNKQYNLVCADGKILSMRRNYKEIYIFCIVSDHYPALSFQAEQFLRYEETDRVKAPFVMDIFLLDVLTEFLFSPLYFLSYVNRRTQYHERLFSTHELTIFSYHLKHNLWIDGEYDR